MKQPSFLEGEHIILRPLQLSDLEGAYVSWLNDEEVCAHNSHHVYPYTPAQGKAYIESMTRDEHNLVLAIVDKENGTHIGNIALQKIDLISRNAEYAILVGDKAYWGKGVGKEASQLILRHGFEAMNLHRIYCGTASTNAGMQKLATSLGFIEEGRRKEAHYKNGAYADLIEYGLLKDAWQA